VGIIEKVGKGVTGYSENQRVFIAPNTGCGHCRQCVSGNNNVCKNYEAVGVTIDGGFAEYMRVPANSVDGTICLCTAWPECTAY
jgi:L-iditol 2-dehydrogenase